MCTIIDPPPPSPSFPPPPSPSSSLPPSSSLSSLPPPSSSPPSSLSPPTSGPVRITVRRVDPPDAFGRVVIHFGATHPNVHCACRTNTTRNSCTDRYVADPQILGPGTHQLTIVCMDSQNYVDTKKLKIILPSPPPLSKCPPIQILSWVSVTPPP